MAIEAEVMITDIEVVDVIIALIAEMMITPATEEEVEAE